MIILLRHPAAIIDSYLRMGWVKDNFERFGYRYGKHMADAIKESQKVTSIVQLYEDVANEPEREFMRLYNFLGVAQPKNYYKIIDAYCRQRNDKWEPYNKKRVSEKEVYKWKCNLDKDVIEAVKRGYFRSDLNYYRDQKDWEM